MCLFGLDLIVQFDDLCCLFLVRLVVKGLILELLFQNQVLLGMTREFCLFTHRLSHLIGLILNSRVFIILILT